MSKTYEYLVVFVSMWDPREVGRQFSQHMGDTVHICMECGVMMYHDLREEDLTGRAQLDAVKVDSLFVACGRSRRRGPLVSLSFSPSDHYCQD